MNQYHGTASFIMNYILQNFLIPHLPSNDGVVNDGANTKNTNSLKGERASKTLMKMIIRTKTVKAETKQPIQ